MREKRIQIEGQDTAYLVRENGTIWSEKRNRELKGTIKRNEYPTVYLMHNGKQYNFMVHRLVAEAFCENPNNYTIVHHKNGNKIDCAASNLEWLTDEMHKKLTSKTINTTVNNIDLTTLNPEEWKEVRGYPDYLINKEGTVVSKKSSRVLLQSDRNGYKRVSLGEARCSVHRLVYFTFNSEADENLYIDHINGNRGDNRLENLRLTTQSENMKNAMFNGHVGQIAVLQFDKKGNFIKEFPTIQAAANEVGVTHAAIRSAVNREGTSGGYKWKRKNI